jgi:acetyl-CoA synthetase
MPRQSVTLAPFTAGAAVFVHRYNRVNAKRTIDLVARCGVSTTCATPTV